MASPALVFYRPADASLAIGIVDDAGHLAPGQSSTASLGWAGRTFWRPGTTSCSTPAWTDR
jgi:hypothetical protein